MHERHGKEGGGTIFCIKEEEQGEGEGKKKVLLKGGRKGGVKRKVDYTMYLLQFFSVFLNFVNLSTSNIPAVKHLYFP